jgi:hypothetical protein
MTNKIDNGTIVKFEGDNDLYEVTQWDGKKGWAQDENGAGWYFVASQVTVVESEATDEANTQEIETTEAEATKKITDDFKRHLGNLNPQKAYYKEEVEFLISEFVMGYGQDLESTFIEISKEHKFTTKETEATEAEATKATISKLDGLDKGSIKVKCNYPLGSSEFLITRESLLVLTQGGSATENNKSSLELGETWAINELKNTYNMVSVEITDGLITKTVTQAEATAEATTPQKKGLTLTIRTDIWRLDVGDKFYKNGYKTPYQVLESLKDGFVKCVHRGKISRISENSQVDAIVTKFGQVADYALKTQATDLTAQATALIDAKYDDQYDFICQAPADSWRAVLEIIIPGACPILWERRRASYDPDHRVKTAAKIAKRKARRKSRQKNGGSVYPSKKAKLNGTMAGLPLAMC